MAKQGFIRIKGFRLGGRSARNTALSRRERIASVVRSLLALLLLAVSTGFGDVFPRAVKSAAALAALGLTGWEAWLMFRGLQPRRRMRMGAGVCACLAGVFGIMAGLIAADAEPGWIGMTAGFGAVAFVSGVVAVWCFGRWRRLRAEAEIRLHELRRIRRRQVPRRLDAF